MPSRTTTAKRLTTVTRKGQITLAADIRRAIGIEIGDKIAVWVDTEREKTILLRPIRSVAESTFGAVPPRKRPEDLDELRRRFQEETAARAAASGHE